LWDTFCRQQNQGLDSLKCLSHNAGMKNVDLSTMTALSLAAARAAPLIMRVDGVTEPLASTPPQDETNGQERQASLATLQAVVGGYIEAIAVPGDESLVLLVNEDGLLRKLPSHPWASAVALPPIVGDAVLRPRALLCERIPPL
jgi:hypothetical protein